MRKILIGIGGKECSVHAVDFIREHVHKGDDVEITFAHVLPNLPAVFWDEGHILSDAEKQERKKVVDTWLAKQRSRIETILRSASETLALSGMRKEQILTRFISDSTDVADSLLEAARDGGYRMIVVGRQCAAPSAQRSPGSVPEKLLQRASGLSIVVVD